MDPAEAPNGTTIPVIHLIDDSGGSDSVGDSEFDVDELYCRSKRRKPSEVLPEGFLAPLFSESMELRHGTRLPQSASERDIPGSTATPETSDPNSEPYSSGCSHYLDSGSSRSSIREIPRPSVVMTSVDGTSVSIPLSDRDLHSAAEKMTMHVSVMPGTLPQAQAAPQPEEQPAAQPGKQPQAHEQTTRPSFVEPAAPVEDVGKVFLYREGTQGYWPNLPATSYITNIIRKRIGSFYPTWTKIPEKTRRDWFKEWKRSVRWAPCDENFMWRAFNKKGSARLRDMYAECKKKMVPANWMGKEFWRELKKYWKSEKYKKLSESNKKNRASKKGGSLHTGGCLSLGTHRSRLAKELGREPTWYETYCRMHKRKGTGIWVEPRAEHFDLDYTSAMRASQSQQSFLEVWTRVAGGRKKGRIYGLGCFAEEGTAQGPEEIVGSPATWEKQIEEVHRCISSLDKEMGAHVQCEYDDLRQQMMMMQEQMLMLNQMQTAVQEKLAAMRHRLEKIWPENGCPVPGQYNEGDGWQGSGEDAEAHGSCSETE